MNEYINQIYNYLSSGLNLTTVMAIFLGFCLTVTVLRVLVCSALRSAQFAVRLNAKDIRAKADIAKIRYGLLKNIAAEFIRVSDKSVSRVPTAALVDRQLATLSLFGWRFINIMNFVEAIEGGMIFVGLILALIFPEQARLFGFLGLGSFLGFRIVAALFDFRTAHKILSNDVLIFTEREIGQFYTADAGGAVTRLRAELIEVISRQTVSMQETIAKLSTVMKDAMNLREWDKTIAQAAAVQTGINEAAEKLKETIGGNNENVAGQLAALTAATAAFTAEQDAFLTQAKLIERNQHILESTYQSYEMTLQNLTQTLGDGLGAYLKMHAQTASQAVNDAMAANIEKMTQLTAGFTAKPGVTDTAARHD